MIEFNNVPAPAMSHAIIRTDEERIEPDNEATVFMLNQYIINLKADRKSLRNENKLLWKMLGLFWVCWIVSLIGNYI